MPKPVYRESGLNVALKRQTKKKQRKKFKEFCNAKHLKACKHRELKRGVGLHFGDEFTHQGLKRQMVECVYETVTVNTNEFGGFKNAEEVEDWREKMTHLIVKDIDEIVKELEEHKFRLLADLAEAQGIPF